MPDHTDDWMHPQMSRSYQVESKPEARPFLIQREKVIICSWSGLGPPTEWKTWSSHKAREERDAELAKLRSAHPAWHLRPAAERDCFGYRSVEVEDDASDLLRRLSRLKARRK